MAFYVGQRVVCIDASAREADGKQRLVEGQIYTIGRLVVEFRTTGGPYGGDLRCVHLNEVTRTDSVPYSLRRFRPVVERKTDISIFKAMLNPSRDEVSA